MAGRDYKIDPDLLRAIAWVESKYNPNAIGKNNNNSIDIGLMQINSQNINYLKSLGITPYQLRNDACMNIYTGAYFLALAFNKWGVTWQAIGAYNAGFKNNEIQNKQRLIYARKINKVYRKIKNNQHQ
ncbi:MAG TPA: transglycosylase SLT domain-containing protein [Arsenophonus nasoniae]|uniref:transglycosylase SLT domain-containing protein n=1 Tax=Arsenophonus nasoniae TaxID=638 RepID=UPI0038797F6D